MKKTAHVTVRLLSCYKYQVHRNNLWQWTQTNAIYRNWCFNNNCQKRTETSTQPNLIFS